ncbi:putative oxidoreductase YkvO [Madurella mycetomatis]|uniref:Oxidoreductase YkvO n=1 Tax=Madurella mycetomatis TaxID=100816 RepID=A0A175VTV6_9PEZI|nr:putative oxidoreductase YkvO [Madurella mycetomatis]
MTIRAIVVGGTSGIGYAMACRIAAASPPTATILISGRTKPANIPHPNMEFRALDATSMREIKRYTDRLRSSSSSAPKPNLDLLVMSQGIMNTAPRTETPEGIDRKMALHYYGKQLLIRELLPLLTDTARIVIVYDGWLGSPDKLLWSDLDLKQNFSLGKAADHCMSMTDGMVQWWAAKQAEDGMGRKRSFVHAWPGGVNTGLLREIVPSFLHGTVRVVGGLLLTSPETCAERLLSGVEKYAEEGRAWSNINNKGRLFSAKVVWSTEQMGLVADHTWEILDKALATRDGTVEG